MKRRVTLPRESNLSKVPIHVARRFLEGIRRSTPKEHFTNATGDMKLSTYVGLQCVYVDLSKPLSHPPASARPRSALATGGCTGVPCQREHLHRFVPFVLK